MTVLLLVAFCVKLRSCLVDTPDSPRAPGALRSGDIRKGALLHGCSLPGTSTLRDLPSSARAVLSRRLSSRPALLEGLPGAPAPRHDRASPMGYREGDKLGEGK